MTARRFEMVEGGSAKFWEVHVEGSSVTVRYGRIGTPGQSKRHDLADPASAAAEAEKLIKQKTKKGYAEVDAAQAEQGVEPLAASPAAAPASTEPALASAPSAAPAPTPPASGPSPDDLPSTTRRHGRLDWVLAPGGGRDWFALDLGIRTSLAGQWALTLRASGEVVRIDLAACSHQKLATLPLDARGYRSIAIHPDGERGAVSDGETCWLGGRPIDGKLDSLRFGADGSLWGFRGQKIVRVGPDGALAWEGALRLDLFALAGERPVVVGYGGAHLPGEGDTLQSVTPSLVETPRLVFADPSFAVACFWMQHEGKWRWMASLWELASASERVVELVGFDGHAALHGGRLHWAAGELELATGTLRTYEVARLGSPHADMGIAGVTVSPEGDELWQLVQGAACVRRFALEGRAERLGGQAHPAHDPWSVALDTAGRCAIGIDSGFEVFASSGERLHRAELGQVGKLAFSPDGSRLAVATNDPPRLHLFDGTTFTKIADVKAHAGDALVFSPAGDRLLTADAKSLLLRDAETLAPQAQLSPKGEIRSAHFSEGRIVAHDYDGRVYVFDDPGPQPSAKKPPKHAPAALLPNAGAYSGDGSPRVELVGEQVVVSTGEELRAFDVATKKARAKVSAHSALGSRTGRVLAIRDPQGALLYRLGEAEPFARLPGMPKHVEATRDGRCVLAALHHGLVLFREEGGRTPSAGQPLVLPGPARTADLAGFTSDTQAFVLHGVAARVPAAEARAVARALCEAFPALVAVPEGDASETGGRAPTDALALYVGFVVARADADAEQGRKGEKAPFDEAGFVEAERLFLEHEAAIRARVAELAPGAELDASGGDHLVACGPLSSAEAKSGRTTYRVNWDAPDQALAMGARGAGTLVCWYD